MVNHQSSQLPSIADTVRGESLVPEDTLDNGLQRFVRLQPGDIQSHVAVFDRFLVPAAGRGNTFVDAT